MKSYTRFLLMLSLSFVSMYAVMFLNVDSTEHIHLSVTRLYMTLLMIAPMALIMLVMMLHMYKNRQKNIILTLSSILVFILSLIFLRQQTFIGDVQYMKAMIPHHSSAILVSEEAEITDPEVKELSIEIIKAQEREIAEMKRMLEKLK